MIVEFKKYNIEIILVNDSEDLTKKMFAEFLSIKNDNLKLIDSLERNPGGARNVGLKYVSGNQVIFWDSDDQPNAHNVIQMSQSLTLSGYDLIIGAYNEKNNKVAVKTKAPSLNASQMLMNPGIWRVMFSTSFIRQTKFVNCRIAEDQIYFANILSLKPKIGLFHKTTYTYNRQKKGITQSDSIHRDYEATINLFLTGNIEKSYFYDIVFFNVLISYLYRTNLKSLNKSIWALRKAKDRYGFSAFLGITKALFLKVLYK